MEDAAQVDVDRRRPPVHVKISQRPDRADAGVADDDFDAAELFHGQSDEAFEILTPGDIGEHIPRDEAPVTLGPPSNAPQNRVGLAPPNSRERRVRPGNPHPQQT